MKADWGVEVLLNAFLTSVLHRMMSFVFGKVLSSNLGRSTDYTD
jgi:hypothetical protein